MFINAPLSQEKLDMYLKELAREYRRLSGTRIPAEIILVGGASILVNYGFREQTYDIDAIIHASSAMKDAINHVRDKYSLMSGWLNNDFTKTRSYTPELIMCSKYYKTFSNILVIRTVSAEYLIAMKLISGRKYKNDLSDIIGILQEHRLRGKPISFDQINHAVNRLYGGWSEIASDSREFIYAVMTNEDWDALYERYRRDEQIGKEIIINFERDYSDIINHKNADAILSALKKKSEPSEQKK